MAQQYDHDLELRSALNKFRIAAIDHFAEANNLPPEFNALEYVNHFRTLIGEWLVMEQRYFPEHQIALTKLLQELQNDRKYR